MGVAANLFPGGDTPATRLSCIRVVVVVVVAVWPGYVIKKKC